MGLWMSFGIETDMALHSVNVFPDDELEDRQELGDGLSHGIVNNGGRYISRTMTTGRHTIAMINCEWCSTTLGWKYVSDCE